MIENMRQIGHGSMVSPVRLAYGLIPLLTVLEKRNVAINRVLKAADIPRFALTDPKYTITFEQELAVTQAALTYLLEPHVSLEVASHYDIKSFSILGLAMRSCATVNDMMSLLFRYPKLAWGSTEIELFETDKLLIYRLLLQPSQGVCEQFLKQRDIATMLGILREATGVKFNFLELRLTSPKPEITTAYDDFFQCPVLFGCPFNDVILNKSQGDAVIVGASSMAQAFYEPQCAQLSETMDIPFRYATSIRERLKHTTPTPDLHAIAQQMAMTPRTLQRRLQAEGVVFSKLLQEVRLQQAKMWLENSRDTLDQIAAQLGFNDAVAFSHAFKRWTNTAPGMWRKNHHDSAGL